MTDSYRMRIARAICCGTQCRMQDAAYCQWRLFADRADAVLAVPPTEAMIKALAIAAAKFDGRYFEQFGRADRTRYLERAKAESRAMMSAASEESE